MMKRLVKNLRIVMGLMVESVSFAIFSIKSDKLRTFLSLSGVTVGIFSIVAVLCAIDSLKSAIARSLQSIGGEVVHVSRYPFEYEDGMDWWDYLQRPNITEDDFEFLLRNTTLSEAVVYTITASTRVSHNRNSYQNAMFMVTTDGLDKVMNIKITKGRNFTGQEIQGGANVTILGYEVAQELFGSADPLGKRVKIKGSNATVIGVLDKDGENLFMEIDEAVIVPLQYGKTLLDARRYSEMLMAAPKDGADRQAFLDELRILMRAHRSLSPSEKDNFSINQMTFIMNVLDDAFSRITKAGWLIGAFSLIIGGFGIANIMFVSVQERMNQIGIQKALGAKRYVILTQFLAEASFMSLAGGLAGILLAYLATLAINPFAAPYEIVLSAENALKGLIISLVIGVIFGLIPAWKASATDPVKAINA